MSRGMWFRLYMHDAFPDQFAKIALQESEAEGSA
jgi:hypothetical protein